MIHKGPLPGPNPLDGFRRPGDFLDCYSVASPLPAADAARVIAAFPGWARRLLTLRNRLMRPLGLRVEAREPGPFGFFPLDGQGPDHVLLGFDDAHLDFRILVLRASGRIHCATWVGPHHIGGRLYLCAVMPFHILILRNAMARLMRAPEGQKTC